MPNLAFFLSEGAHIEHLLFNASNLTTGAEPQNYDCNLNREKCSKNGNSDFRTKKDT